MISILSIKLTLTLAVFVFVLELCHGEKPGSPTSQMSKGVTFVGLPLTMVLLVRLLLIMSTSLTLRVRVGRALRESDKLRFDR
jgi:hypothetical protein